MIEPLEAIHDGRRVGRLTYSDDRLTFAYDDEWRGDSDAFPLSLSMPLVRPEYPDEATRPFISGLLPDDAEVLRRWGQKFQVSPRNPFRLLAHVGEECAGAVQFVPLERASRWLGNSPPEGIDWLTDGELIERIDDLIQDRSVARRLGDEGHFSLAGAQAKTALYRDPEGGRWGIPKGATPTTHIIKPNRGEFAAFEINEHFCLRLAAQLGLKTAHSWTETIGKTPVLVIERYDRARIDGCLVRIHQEDTCQSLSRSPENKYQNEGGPSAAITCSGRSEGTIGKKPPRSGTSIPNASSAASSGWRRPCPKPSERQARRWRIRRNPSGSGCKNSCGRHVL